MYDYIAFRVIANPCTEVITDLIAYNLAEIGFESFEPDEKGLTAYIRKDNFDLEGAETAAAYIPFDTVLETKYDTIEGEDWNQEWEQNYFKPISIDGECVVRSSFHKDAPKAPIEILIDPKMAFGTGHHATTAGMMRLLLQEDLHGKSVIDMGTGTGILSILCKKLGAAEVSAIEIDRFALENAEENGKLNDVEVNWICGDASALINVAPADYFLANINLNVILADMDKYVAEIKNKGIILLSGFYEKDLPAIRRETSKYGLTETKVVVENDWVAVRFEKSE